jgi:hypothetical protein
MESPDAFPELDACVQEFAGYPNCRYSCGTRELLLTSHFLTLAPPSDTDVHINGALSGFRNVFVRLVRYSSSYLHFYFAGEWFESQPEYVQC